MVRKIGNTIVMLVWCCSLYATIINDNDRQANATITMRLLDHNGEAVNQVAVGVPFILEVTVSSQQGAIEVPAVRGLQSFVVEHQTQVSTINSVMNGVRSTKKIFQYHMRADKQGSYTIGPASSIVDNQRIQSSLLTVIVGPHHMIGPEQPHMQVLVDKNRVFIGEKIVCTVRFYPGTAANLEGISEPNFSSFSASPLEGPFTGSEYVDGLQRSYVEWRSILYPEKTGEITIPALVAVCRMERKRSKRFDMFEHFFDNGLEQKQVYSNTLTVHVDELPSYAGHVHGVGTFTNVKAELDHEVAQEGEGIVLRLVLEGNGNFSSIDPLKLSLPDGLKYYDSKQYMQDDKKKNTKQRKVFEYIIQGTKPGVWVINPQIFTYFDPVDRTYKQLRSNERTLTITPLSSQSLSNKHNDTPLFTKQTSDPGSVCLLYDKCWYASEERRLPWFWFFFLLCVPILLVVGWYAHKYIKKYRKKNTSRISSKYALKRARALLKKTQRDQDITGLHDIFIGFIAQRCMIETSQVSSEFITRRLQQLGCTPDFLVRWHLFFNELLQSKFGSVRHDTKQVMALYAHAEYWLNELYKIL